MYEMVAKRNVAACSSVSLHGRVCPS